MRVSRALQFLPLVLLATCTDPVLIPVFGLTLLTGCPPEPKPPTDRVEGATCASTCEHMATLKDDDGKASCRGFRGSPNGGACKDICINAEEGGAVWALECYSAATSCASARLCPR